MGARITVVGAGSGALTLAGRLAAKGIQVAVFEHPEYAGSLGALAERKCIELIPHLSKDGRTLDAALRGTGQLALVTTDPSEAAHFADLLVMVVPGYAQERFFEQLIPFLEARHTLVMMPGNFGSLVLRRMLVQAQSRSMPVLAEASTIPFACRAISPTEVFVLAEKTAIKLGVWPVAATKAVSNRLSEIVGMPVYSMQNVAEAGLSNMNMVVHPATALLSMGIAESRNGQYIFYKEGMSKSVARVQEQIDTERQMIGAAIGIELPSFCDETHTLYDMDFESIYDFAQHTPIHGSFGYDGPSSPRDRYISEDCPYSLVPTWALGQAVGASTRAIESVIALASIMNDEDYFASGRNLARMGLEGMSRDAIVDYCSA